MSPRRIVKGLAALFHRRALDQELDNEITAHVEMAEKDARAAGHSPEEARRLARLRFGGIEQVKEAHREQRGLHWMDNLLRDLRYGAASLARSPGFTAVAVGILALGTGANVAMFSVVDAVLLKPLPFAEPDRIVGVWEAPRPGASNSTTATEFVEWKRLGTTFSALAAENSISAAVHDGIQPLRLAGKAVTEDFFKVFALRAAMGRVLRGGDTADTVVLSHAAWQSHFGGRLDILNRRILMDGVPHQVVGVLERGAFDRAGTQFWKPLIFTPEQLATQDHWLQVFGRLAGSLPRSREQMQAIHTAMTASSSEEAKLATIAVEPLAGLLVGRRLERSIQVAFGAVLLVLLIACANVANLLLAKGASRRGELAVRAALGAGRARLLAQLLTESVLLCMLGGLSGAVLGGVLIGLVNPLLAGSVPFTAEAALDWRALAFATAIAFATALVVGVLPALQTGSRSVVEGLNRTARGSSGMHARIRRSLVIGEVALSLVLLCGALLLFRSLLALQGVETGIRIENVLTLRLSLPANSYPAPRQASLFYQDLAQRLAAIPGVTHAGLSTHIPLSWISNGEAAFVPGIEKPLRNRFKRVDAGYFSAFGIPIVAGRGFTNLDASGAPNVVVINRPMAARIAEAAGIPSPVGRRIRISGPGYIKPAGRLTEVEIVGIIAGELVNSPGSPEPPVIYAPLAQLPSSQVAAIIRTQSAAMAVLPAIREAVRQVDPAMPLAGIATMEQVRSRTLSGVSGPAKLIGAFAAVALLLAGVGLYGVLSQMVTQRRREIGIRMALGARPREVLSGILRNALAMIAAGLAIGLAGTIALTRVLKSLLFEVSPLDPQALTLGCASLLLLGLLAGYLPAIRAARVDPVNVLREET